VGDDFQEIEGGLPVAGEVGGDDVFQGGGEVDFGFAGFVEEVGEVFGERPGVVEFCVG
jgi:hypothetical protein